MALCKVCGKREQHTFPNGKTVAMCATCGLEAIDKLLAGEATGHVKPGESDCGYACGWQEPYGFVPEFGCPIHDPEPPQKVSAR